MTYKFKVTEGCPKTGHDIACNTTQEAPAFSTNQPSTAQVAEREMCKRASERASQEAYRRAKKAANGKPKSEPERWLSNDDLT